MQFAVNSHRFEPYKNFKFRVKWDGRYVAGVSKCGALKRVTEAVAYREGGDLSSQRNTPGQTTYDAVALERGVTYDTEFEKWANMVYSTESDASVSLKDYKKLITIELLNLQGKVVKSYKLHNAWVTEYQALPELDASASAYAIELLTIQYEGWERDEAVVEEMET